MANVERVTVTVSADQAAVLRSTVDHGEYASASEIIREALRDWTRKRDRERQDIEALRRLIREGDESGVGTPVDEVVAELRQLIAERRAGRA